MPAIRAVIFDFYGTLVDILTDEGKDEIFDHLSRYLQYYGARTSAPDLKALYQAEKERYRQTRSEKYGEFDMLAVFETVLKKLGMSNPFLAESCCKIFRLVSRERFQLFPDSVQALKDLKKRSYLLALLSNAQNVFFHEEAEMLGLAQFFPYILVSSYFGFRKPDPRFFALGCAMLGVHPAEAVYVGDDTLIDVKGAGEAGLRTILVDRLLKQQDREPKPDFYASDLKAACRWIEGSPPLAKGD